MNSAPNQSNNTFNSQPATGSQGNPFASQSNPFTADLKGEFSSNFGTNTNAVSQIFKDGSFGGSNRTKYIAIGAAVLLVFGAFWYLTGTQDAADTEATEDDLVEEAAAPSDTPAEEKTAPANEATPATPAVESAVQTSPAAEVAPVTGALSLNAPENGASMAYDETQGSASFSWNGGAGTIVFSRSADMKPEVMRVKVSGSNYSFHHPWPGQWYWKVESGSGASEVRSFSVAAPVRRNIAMTAPAQGATLAGTGGVVSWTGDKGVAYYRVELSSNDDWSNPQFKFSSSGSQLQLSGVTAGTYNMRLGAFSEVSGRWEYAPAVKVTIQ